MSTGMITNTNLFSLSSLVAAGRNQGDLSQSINRLSSGLRINSFMMTHLVCQYQKKWEVSF